MDPFTPPPLRNIELKVRCSDLQAAQTALQALSPRDGGVQIQTDTYFNVRHGRLKLREIDGLRAELIGYQRADRAESRPSDYRLVPVPDPAALKLTLAAALGIAAIVSKRRQILLWHNVRIHLDQVQGIGDFIEFEAVMSASQSESAAHERLVELCKILNVPPSDRLANSYLELLRK